MGIKTLVQGLLVGMPESNGLHDSGRRQLDRVLHDLERKQADLQRQLQAETRPAKRRHLLIELRTTQLQHEKGLAQRLGRRRGLPLAS